MPEVQLAFPGRLDRRTGGYTYDRRAFAALAARGWRVVEQALPDLSLLPDDQEEDAVDGTWSALPDGTIVVVDGLAFGKLPDLAAKHAARLRLVALVHHPLYLETGLDLDDQFILQGMETEALRHARHVLCTSTTTKATLATELQVPSDRITVAEPGVDRAPLARGRDHPSPVLLCVGTVTPRKAHALLVEALAPLVGLPWRLVCAGSLERDPKTADALRAAITARELGNRIELRGELDDDAIAEAYADASALVSASLYEGYGMALTEALARGLPVIAAAGGAAATTVPDAAGLLVAPGDVRALTSALARFLSEPDLRFRLAAGAAAARERLGGWDETAAVIDGALSRL